MPYDSIYLKKNKDNRVKKIAKKDKGTKVGLESANRLQTLDFLFFLVNIFWVLDC